MKQSTKNKERTKAFRKYQSGKSNKDVIVEDDKQTEIIRLESQLRANEYDLNFTFPNNIMIINKILILKERIRELKNSK